MPAITVTFPVSIDVDSGNVELFGQVVSSSEQLLDLNVLVPALDLSGMIQYTQATDPNDVSLATAVAVTGFNPVDFVADLSGALNDGVTIDKSSGEAWWPNTYDSRKASAASGNPLYNYDSVYQFLLGVVAYEVFSHPLAQAGISNDTQILESLGNAEVANKLWDAVALLSNEQLKTIFQQIVAQDSTRVRFNRDDLSGNSQPDSHPDDSPQYLQFKPDDMICFEIHLNAYNAVRSSTTASAPGVPGMAGSDAADAGNTLMSGGNDTFTVRVTLS